MAKTPPSDDLIKQFSKLDPKTQAKALRKLSKIHAKCGGDVALTPVNTKVPRPILKWPGGKRKMIPHIISVFPNEYGTYFEPFLGGGALFFWLKQRGLIKRAVLSDYDPQLISCYEVVRDSIDELLEALSHPKFKNQKKEYLIIRAIDPNKLSKVEAAARYIYLNKTGFNGLMRVNSKGEFNTPFGKHKNPVIRDEVNLRAVSDALQRVTLRCGDFEEGLKGIKKGDLTFLDPPYAAISKTSGFASFTKVKFTDEDHRRLAGIFEKLISRRVHAIMMNSTAELCRELYNTDRFSIKKIMGPRSIGGPDHRSPAGEMIVSR